MQPIKSDTEWNAHLPYNGFNLKQPGAFSSNHSYAALALQARYQGWARMRQVLTTTDFELFQDAYFLSETLKESDSDSDYEAGRVISALLDLIASQAFSKANR